MRDIKFGCDCRFISLPIPAEDTINAILTEKDIPGAKLLGETEELCGVNVAGEIKKMAFVV